MEKPGKAERLGGCGGKLQRFLLLRLQRWTLSTLTVPAVHPVAGSEHGSGLKEGEGGRLILEASMLAGSNSSML